VVTSPFGYYRFDDVRTGATYIISASAKSYRFTPIVVNVTDELTGLDLTANGDSKAAPVRIVLPGKGTMRPNR
jgi:hypothetical protein